MKIKEFEEQFHDLHTVYSRKSNEMGEQLKAKYEQDRADLSMQIDQEKFDEIGKQFKKMDLNDKIQFLELYVSRAKLAKYLEPHEISALRIMEWPFLVHLQIGNIT